MKDARFKELLNLYLDHRLNDAEAAEFDAALQADPARRKTLRDYESMQGACSALFARVEARAPSSDALRRALRQVEDRIENPRSLRDAWGWPTWGVTGGLAACVALVVARLSQPAVLTAEAPAGAEPVVVAAVEAPAPAAKVARAPMPNQIAFAALGLSASSANADAASRWILTTEEPSAYAGSAEVASAETPAWAGAAPADTSGRFSARPINAWRQASGYQVETAAYRFER